MNQLNTRPDSRTRWQKYWWLYLGLSALLLVAVALEFYRASLARKIETEVTAIHREHYPITLAELNDLYPAIMVQDNAALLLNRAFAELSIDPKVPSLHWPRRSERLPAELQERFSKTLATNQTALEWLHEAAKLKQSRFPLDMTAGYALLLPHLAKIQQASELLKAQTALFIEQGAANRAFESVLDGLALAHALAAEPILISQMVRRASIGITLTGLERLLAQMTLDADQLHVLLQALASAEIDEREGMIRALVGERCFGNQIFKLPPKHAANVLDSGSVPGAVGSQADLMMIFLGLRDVSGFTQRDRLFYLDNMRDLIEIAKLPYPECLEKTKTIDQRLSIAERQRKRFLLSFMLLPSYRGMFVKNAQALALLRAAYAAVSVELYREKKQGHVPKQLDDLVPEFLPAIPKDPFTGKPLLFKGSEKGYRIYSVGTDGADDGGQDAEGHRPEEVLGPLTPKKPTKATKAKDVTFVVER